MQISLFETTSYQSVVRQMGQHNLSVCMLAMEELGKSYISAVAAYKLFRTAMQKVEMTQCSDEAPPISLGRPGDTAPFDFTQSEALNDWPPGYETSMAGVISDVWSPWHGGMAMQ